MSSPMTTEELIEALREKIEAMWWWPPDARSLLRAAASRLEARSGAPAGWKLVPEEPTPEMIAAGEDAFQWHQDAGGQWVLDDASPDACYRAMLSAAPPPPAESGWRPIEEAPRDGTEVDLWGISLCSQNPKKMRQTNCHYHCGEWLRWEALDGEPTWTRVVEVTHWMPLPPSPQPSGEGSDAA